MDSQKPDWEINTLYSQAYKIVKNHKLLWLLGVAAATGNSFNFRSANSFNSSDFQKLFQKNPAPLPETGEKISAVLGTSTSSFDQSVGAIFSSLPLTTYLLLGLEFVILVVIGVVIIVIYQAWVRSLHLNAVDQAIKDDQISLKLASQKAMPTIKPMIWLAIIPNLLLGALALTGAFVIGFGLAFTGGIIKGLFILLGVLGFIALLIAVIYLMVIQVWAVRFASLEDKSGRQSFIAGFKLAKKKFWSSLLLGIVNNILSVVIIMIPVIGVLFIVGGSAFIVYLTKSFSLWMVPLAMVLVLALIIGFSLFGGAINSFKATVWNLAFKNVKDKYK